MTSLAIDDAAFHNPQPSFRAPAFISAGPGTTPCAGNRIDDLFVIDDVFE
jgi:hypothetical protein